MQDRFLLNISGDIYTYMRGESVTLFYQITFPFVSYI
jgi:hypothetical protein